jgi:hypothetical protein
MRDVNDLTPRYRAIDLTVSMEGERVLSILANRLGCEMYQFVHDQVVTTYMKIILT